MRRCGSSLRAGGVVYRCDRNEGHPGRCSSGRRLARRAWRRGAALEAAARELRPAEPTRRVLRVGLAACERVAGDLVPGAMMNGFERDRLVAAWQDRDLREVARRERARARTLARMEGES